MGVSPERLDLDPASAATSQIAFLVALLWDARYVLAFCAIAGLVIGGVTARFTQPVYRATVVLMPTQDAELGDGLGSVLSQAGGIAALVGLGGTSANRTDEAIAVLESRKFTESFIEDFGLLPRLFPNKWDEETKAWRVTKKPPPSLYDGFRQFEDDVRRVRRDAKTGLVTLDIVWPDANEAAVLANSMVSRLNDSIRDRDIGEATTNIEQLSIELDRTKVLAVQLAMQKLIEANVRRRTLANTRVDYVFRVIDPAMPVDPRDYFRPRPVLYVAAGGLCGLLLGIVFVALRRFVGLLRPVLGTDRIP
jgi:uncharacterized protein involved in exopolysaccharide biosynthesis